MHFQASGSIENPALVCVPGLLGGPEDFHALMNEWRENFYVIVLDPNHERREKGLANLTAENVQDVPYNSTADDIATILKDIKKDRAFLVGISLGGKVIYDFGIKFPEMFAGGLVTDVGPAPFEDSELYKTIDETVKTTSMDLPWPEMKKDLQQRIPDRSMRSLIQTQLFYPEGKPPAIWKTPMKNFGTMIRKQEIADQFEGLHKVDARLKAENRIFHVLHAQELSGISDESLPDIRKLTSIRIIDVPNASHFLHVTHKDLLSDVVRQQFL